MIMTEKNDVTRNLAMKVSIDEIKAGTYVQEREQQPNYIIIKDQKVYRINLLATIINKEVIGSMNNFLLDDGTGTVVARLFEEQKRDYTFNVGNCIIVIGKVRVFKNEKYISPEIIKNIDALWLRVRSKEISSMKKVENETKNHKKELSEEEEINEESVENNISLTEQPKEKILKIIKSLDTGEGVIIENIMELSPFADTEKIIERMLEKGDIFQIVPGKIKIL